MRLKDKNVLITGGAGFIGSHLVDRVIREDPSKLLVVDNFFLGQESNLREARSTFPDLKVYRIDASDLASMRELAEQEKIDVVFNLAAIPLPMSISYPRWTINVNTEIATTSCELARQGVIDTLIHCSSSEVYGSAEYIPMDERHPHNATTPYAASKAAQDLIVLSYLRTYNINVVIMRPFNNFGPRQNQVSYAGIIPIIIQKVLNKEPIEIFGDGEQTRDYVFVQDTADMFVQIYNEQKTRGLEINLATGHEITINELVRRMLDVMGVPDHPVIHTSPRRGDVRQHCGDISVICDLVGYEPRPVCAEHLEQTISWYKGRKA